MWASRTIQPSPPPMTRTRTIIPRTLKRRNLRQGRETGSVGIVLTHWIRERLEVIHSSDPDYTHSPDATLVPTHGVPRSTTAGNCVVRALRADPGISEGCC